MIDRRQFVVQSLQSLGLMAGGTQLTSRPGRAEALIDSGHWPPKEFIALERLLEITEYAWVM